MRDLTTALEMARNSPLTSTSVLLPEAVCISCIIDSKYLRYTSVVWQKNGLRRCKKFIAFEMIEEGIMHNFFTNFTKDWK